LENSRCEMGTVHKVCSGSLGHGLQKSRLLNAPLTFGVFAFLVLSWAGCATIPPPSKERAYQHFTSGAYYEDQGKPKEAIREYQQALRYDPEAVEVWTTLAEAYYNDNQFRESEEAAEQALRRDSLSVAARIVKANSYLARKLVAPALAEYERASHIAPERWDILYTLSNLYELRGDFRTAADKLHEILLLNPEAVDIKSRMAGLYVKSKALDKAEEVYVGMLLEDSLSIDGHLGLGLVYEFKREFSAAAAEYETALAMRPTNLVLKRRLLNVYQNAGERDKALEMSAEILARDSLDVGVRITQGVILYNAKRYPEAQSAFRKVLGGNPKDATAHYYLGRIAYDQKDYAGATAEMQAATRLDSKLASAWVYCGVLSVRAGDEKKAFFSFKQAIGTAPQTTGGLDYLLGYAYAETDSYARALAAYQQALRLNPNDPRTHYGMGVAYDKLGKTDSAVAAFKRVIALDSTDGSAYNYIGYLFADKGIHLEESLELIKKALVIDPENGYFLDSMAWAYYKLGRYQEAAQEQEKACALVKDDVVLLDHLGDIYHSLGKAKEARAQWQRALELDPKNEGLKKKLSGEQ